jgi:hypothetical protein
VACSFAKNVRGIVAEYLMWNLGEYLLWLRYFRYAVGARQAPPCSDATGS